MAKDRIEPCTFYICVGQCTKGKVASHNGLCQTCGKYMPRVRKKHPNEKKKYNESQKKKDGYDY